MIDQGFMNDAFRDDLDLSIEVTGDPTSSSEATTAKEYINYRHTSHERQQEYDTSIQDAYILPPINVDVAMMPIAEDMSKLNYNDLVDLNVVNMDDNSEPNSVREAVKSPDPSYDEVVQTTPLCFLKLFSASNTESDFELLPSYKFQELTEERINNLVRVTLDEVESSGQLTESSTASVASLSRKNALYYKNGLSEPKSWDVENISPRTCPSDYAVLVNPTLSESVIFNSLSPATRARSLPGEVLSEKPGPPSRSGHLKFRSKWHRFWPFNHCSGTPRSNRSTADGSTD
ncbi:hypothetical protein TRVA0_010S03114 [Trichomonascus vanleenenianus]|uniref:uncharacterized protein n=1 Tax=Trichomonascus vanleenenianus TaxID=2268995 RepID=UPI003EC995C0